FQFAWGIELMDDRISAVTHTIVEQVKNHWDESGTVLLLTILGDRLTKMYPDYKSIINDGLGKFISDKKCVQLVPHPDIPSKMGLLPLEVVLPPNTRPIFVQ